MAVRIRKERVSYVHHAMKNGSRSPAAMPSLLRTSSMKLDEAIVAHQDTLKEVKVCDCSFLDEENPQEALVQLRAAAHMLNWMEFAGWNQWRSVSAIMRKQRNVVRGIIARMSKREMSRAWEEWKSKHEVGKINIVNIVREGDLSSLVHVLTLCPDRANEIGLVSAPHAPCCH